MLIARASRAAWGGSHSGEGGAMGFRDAIAKRRDAALYGVLAVLALFLADRGAQGGGEHVGHFDAEIVADVVARDDAVRDLIEPRAGRFADLPFRAAKRRE